MRGRGTILKPKGLKFLGNPFNKTSYAKNIWDMQVYNGCIYFGHGNSSNNAPNANAGPITIYKYDPASGIFSGDFIVDDEQIDIFRVINGYLYIPGHDAREDADICNYYRLNSGIWTKYRNVPNAVHVFDIVGYNGRIYIGVGATTDPCLLQYTTNGTSWTSSGVDPWYMTESRVYSLFVMNNMLYGFAPGSTSGAIYNSYVEINGDTITKTNYTFANMYPSCGASDVKIVKPTVIGGNILLFICGQVYNDQQMVPLGLYKCTTIGTSTKLTLPNASALPMDILVRDNTIYLLTYVKNNSSSYTIIVYRSTNIDNWTEVLRFNYDTFARSFEELNGDFYFGMGCYTDVIPNSVGDILLIRNGGY